MYFESHAHYDDKRYKKDRDELLKIMHENGVSYIVNVGADMPSTEFSRGLAEKYDFIYFSPGVHPHEVKSMTDDDLAKLEQYCSHEKCVAVGEIGLDYHYEFSPKDLQVHWFKKQLELSKKVNLPVIIHSREASQQTFDIIKESGVRQGVIHCYSGASQMALDYVDMGFYIGIGGVVTFDNASRLRKVVEDIPIESILIETDAPYLTPEPHRGQRNNSIFLKHVVDKIAEIKGLSPLDVANITEENGKKLFFSKKGIA